MATHIKELLAQKSTFVICLVGSAITLFLSVGSVLFSSDPQRAINALVAYDDFFVFFMGVFATVAITSYCMNGSIYLDMLVIPNRVRIYFSRILAISVLTTLLAICTFVLDYFSIVLFSRARGINHPALSYAISKLLLLIIINEFYILLGSGLGFAIRSTSSTLLSYIGITAGLPIILPILSLTVHGFPFWLVKADPISLTALILSSHSQSLGWGFLGLALWAITSQLTGYLRFKELTA